LLRTKQIAQPSVRYFLWLTMSVNLFIASTYIAVAPIIKFGDSYILVHELPGQWFWRSAVALLGAVLWWFSFRLCRAELGKLIGVGGSAARSLALNLVVPAYIAGGIVTVMSGLLSQLEAKWAQLQAAGGTFGLTIWLLLLPFTIPAPSRPSNNSFALTRSVRWIVAGLLGALIFVGVLGRGIAL